MKLESASAGLGFSLLWKIFQRPPWKWWIFRWVFGRKMHKKNPPKKSAGNPPAEKKNPPAHDPPEIHQPGPKISRKNLPTNLPVNLQVHAGSFSIKAYSGRRLQSMDSGTLFGCLLGMVEAPMLNALVIPQLLRVGGTRFAAHPSRQRLSSLSHLPLDQPSPSSPSVSSCQTSPP